jgi:hypothetical protein
MAPNFVYFQGVRINLDYVYSIRQDRHLIILHVTPELYHGIESTREIMKKSHMNGVHEVFVIYDTEELAARAIQYI